jgi:O-antigen ligase
VVVVVIAVTAAFAPGGSGTSSIPHPGNGGFSHGRLHLWSAAIDVAEQRPLYGFGADSFLTATLARQARFQAPVRYAHSLPLEAAVELGIVGFVLVLALYATNVHALLQRRNTQQVWLLGPAVAAFLIANLIDWSWHLAGSGAIWAAALGGTLAATQGAAARGRRS